MLRSVFILLALLCACERSASPEPLTAFPARTVEGQLRSGASLVDITLAGPPRIGVDVDRPGLRSFYVIFSATIHAGLSPQMGRVASERLEVVFFQTILSPGVDAGTPPVQRTVDGGVLTIESGGRYVAAVLPISYRESELWGPLYLSSVDAQDRIVQPFLEFPAGTPVSVVLAPRNVTADLLTRSDAGTSLDAD